MSENINEADLHDQAFALVFALNDGADAVQVAAIKTQISQFKALSIKHEMAITRAEAEWALMGQFEPKALNTRQKTHLFIQQKVASIADKPQQLMPIAAVLLMALLLPMWASFSSPAPDLEISHLQTETARYVTAYGQRSEITLSDGSTLSLNWNTQLQVTFSANQRSVSLLKGEAIFSVAKDSSRPFIVSVGDVQARAVGTQFSVQKLDNNHADIAVTEGVVEVSITTQSAASSGASPTVQLHESQTVIASNQQLSAITHFSNEEINAWRDGMLVFNNRSLGDVLIELNRYTPYTIEVDPQLNSSEEVTATYFLDQTDEALASLAQLFSLQMKTSTNARSTTVFIRSTPVSRPIY